MNVIAKLLAPENILLDFDAGSKKRVFEQAGLLFENQLHISHTQVFDSLFAREKLGSTGLGHGIAIPHGRMKGLREAAGAFIRVREPIPFDAPDHRPVALAFVLLVPEKATDAHLQILSELVQMFSDKALRDQLFAATDAATVHQLISEWQSDAARQRSATA